MTLTTDTTKVDVPLGISWLIDIVAYPDGVAVDAAGNVYVTDWGHGVVELARPNTFGNRWRRTAHGWWWSRSPTTLYRAT